MRIRAAVLASLMLAGAVEGQESVGFGAAPCWRSGAQVTTACVRRSTARVERGEISRTELLEMLAVGSGAAAGAAVADFLVEVVRSRELDEVEQAAVISLAASLPGDRNRERALAYLAAHEPLSSYNVAVLLGATRGISSGRLRGALLLHIARTQPLDTASRETLSRAAGVERHP